MRGTRSTASTGRPLRPISPPCSVLGVGHQRPPIANGQCPAEQVSGRHDGALPCVQTCRTVRRVKKKPRPWHEVRSSAQSAGKLRDLLMAQEVADFFGVSVETVYRWRMRPESKFP